MSMPKEHVMTVLREELDLTPRVAKILKDDFSARDKAAKWLFKRRNHLGIEKQLDVITAGRCSNMQISWLRESIHKLAAERLVRA